MILSVRSAILAAACFGTVLAVPAAAVRVPGTAAEGVAAYVDLTEGAAQPYSTIWSTIFFTHAPVATVHLDFFGAIDSDDIVGNGYVGTISLDPSAFAAMTMPGGAIFGTGGETFYGARFSYDHAAVTDGVFSVSAYQPTASFDDLRALMFYGAAADGTQSGWVRTEYIDESVVPEPAGWMTMVLGFGALGYAIRRSGRRREPAIG